LTTLNTSKAAGGLLRGTHAANGDQSQKSVKEFYELLDEDMKRTLLE
jgi:hypothetical protein